jgi:dihydroneopterin aldolase
LYENTLISPSLSASQTTSTAQDNGPLEDITLGFEATAPKTTAPALDTNDYTMVGKLPATAVTQANADAAETAASAVSSGLNDDTQPLQRVETDHSQAQATDHAKANEAVTWPTAPEPSLLSALDDALAEAAPAGLAAAPAKSPKRKKRACGLA